MKIAKYILLSILIIGFNSCNDSQTKPDNAKKINYNVLFIGNSFTFYNIGIDYHLQKMLNADKSADSINYNIQKIAVSSYTLQDHYSDSLTIQKIRGEKWNKVVLQEQSTRPISNPDLFLQYATKLDFLIKKDSAATILYMTWAPKDSPTDIVQLASAYISVGSKLKSNVVPVGKVWEYTVNTYPQLNLYFTDNKHPALTGTFLIACAFYKSLFNKNPVENSYIPEGLTTGNVITIRKAVNDYMSIK
jgi:hypothetical protein